MPGITNPQHEFWRRLMTFLVTFSENDALLRLLLTWVVLYKYLITSHGHCMRWFNIAASVWPKYKVLLRPGLVKSTCRMHMRS